jgi:predicted transcriptional regulator of viral defense system
MEHMNGDTGQALPPVNTIAKLIGPKPNKVREWRGRIVELGFIDKIGRGKHSTC